MKYIPSILKSKFFDCALKSVIPLMAAEWKLETKVI